VSGLTLHTFTTPSVEAEASFRPLADHASAVTGALWLVLLLLLELTKFLRVNSAFSAVAAVPGRLLIAWHADGGSYLTSPCW